MSWHGHLRFPLVGSRDLGCEKVYDPCLMKKYLLVHAIQSPLKIRKLENYLSENFPSYHLEQDTAWPSYEIQTNLLKADFIEFMQGFILKLSLNINERVVIYDYEIYSDLLKVPSEYEKIILNGNIERESMAEKVMVEIFEYIKTKSD